MNLVKRECPWCSATIQCPKSAVEKAVEGGKTMPCPECGDLFAFTGEWKDVEKKPDMSMYEHAGTADLE
jgi:hypothetical protein